MDALIQKIFSEQGVIVGLFVFMFVYFIYKGVPFIFSLIITKFDKVIDSHTQIQKTQLETHSEMQREQHTFFKENLEKIASTFVGQIEQSNMWHAKLESKQEASHREILEVKELIKKQSK